MNKTPEETRAPEAGASNQITVTMEEALELAANRYTVKAAAKILGVSTNTVYSYVRAGILPAARIGARWLISETDLKTLLLEGRDAAKQRR